LYVTPQGYTQVVGTGVDSGMQMNTRQCMWMTYLIIYTEYAVLALMKVHKT